MHYVYIYIYIYIHIQLYTSLYIIIHHDTSFSWDFWIRWVYLLRAGKVNVKRLGTWARFALWQGWADYMILSKFTPFAWQKLRVIPKSWGYPQSSSIGDFSLTIQLLGYLHFRKPPYCHTLPDTLLGFYVGFSSTSCLRTREPQQWPRCYDTWLESLAHEKVGLM